MFSKLQKKWNVGGWQLILVIATFAIGGSLTGWLGRKILAITPLEHNWLYYLLYIVLITLIWPFVVLLISIPLGQFSFFKKYLRRILDKIIRSKTLSDNQENRPSA